MNHSWRFTLDGSAALERRIGYACERVLDAVASVVSHKRLQALILGGGYGRGEGGVLRTGTGDKPYNDLEFYVCLRGFNLLNERRFQRKLHQLAESLSHKAGIEVELKVFSLRKLRHSAPNMFLYDLVMGHRWIMGEERMLKGCDRHRRAELIPESEAARLLMNRLTSLLFARELLAREPFSKSDADYVARNVAKAQLAFGDAFLTMHKQYHWSCRDRHQRLLQFVRHAEFHRFNEMLQHHRAGVEFKLHPVLTTAAHEELRESHAAVLEFGCELWRWIEQRRLGREFANVRQYAECALNKCPDSSSLRNMLVNLKAFGWNAPCDGRIFRYPRERLLNALPVLLWDPEAFENRALLKRLARELRGRAADRAGLLASYRALWSQFN